MLVIIVAAWAATLLLLILAITNLPNKNNRNYSVKKRNILLTVLAIYIVCSLAFIAVFISAVFDIAASV